MTNNYERICENCVRKSSADIEKRSFEGCRVHKKNIPTRHAMILKRCYFFVWSDKKKIWHISESSRSELFPCQISKSFDKYDVVKKCFFSKKIGNVMVAKKWRHISIFLSSIERGDQYDSFDVPINWCLRQLVTTLGQLFIFSLCTGHMTSLECLVTQVTYFFFKIFFFFFFFTITKIFDNL